MASIAPTKTIKPIYAILDPDAEHKINGIILDNYEPLVLDIIKGKKLIPITHSLDLGLPQKFDESSRKLNMNNRKKYVRRTYEYKPALHWGQLKLFLSEVEFLVKVMQECKDPDVDIWFVYAGAAPGHHIGYLSKLFPKIHFELYDPNEFVVKTTDMVKTHVQFFTGDDAKFWADSGKYVVFCSDIRTEPATAENIERNMKMQLAWWKIMNPELAMFKFRLPWELGQTEYPDGDIYIQAYPGPTSSETRLICKKNAKLRFYNNIEYEDACYYHNSVVRPKKYITALGNLSLPRDGLDNCYDCSSFVHIMYSYCKIVGKPPSELRQLLKDIQLEISFGKATVLSHSIKYFGEAITNLTKQAYVPCNNKKCLICTIHIASGPKSKATIENEKKQKSVVSDKDLDSL